MSSSNARQHRSRALCMNDFEKDDLEDLRARMKSQKEADKFIQEIQLNDDPFIFRTIFFKARYFKILLALRDELGFLDCGIDATGTVVRKPKENSKVIYYYALTTRLPPTPPEQQGTLLQNCGMVANSHTAESISKMLDAFKFNFLNLNKLKSWPLYTDCTMDFSFAMINSVSISFNNMNLVSYLKIMYSLWIKKERRRPFEINFTLLHLCIGHLFKTLSDDCSQYFQLSAVQHNIKKLFALFALCRSRQQYHDLLESLFTLLLVPKRSTLYIKCIEHLQSSSNSENSKSTLKKIEDIVKLNAALEIPKISDAEFGNNIYENSPFYQEALKLKEKFLARHKDEIEESSVDGNLADNGHYSPDFIDMFLQKYISLSPFFINNVASREVNLQII